MKRSRTATARILEQETVLGQASSRAVLGGSQRRICLWEGEVDGVIAFGGVESSGGDEDGGVAAVGEFRFFLSCNLNSSVPRSSMESSLSINLLSRDKRPELYVECALYIDGVPFGLPMRTRLNTTGPPYCWNKLITVWDTELGKFNPSEHKQLKLAKSLDRGIIDRDLKPSNNERKSIQRVLKYPPTRTLSGDERQSFFAVWSGVMFRMFQTMLAYFLMMARDFTNQSHVRCSHNQIIYCKYFTISKIATLTCHTYRVMYVAVSPDGQTIVTGAGDETVRFWNVFPSMKTQNEALRSGENSMPH
ncbi:hypothetical protein HID58_021913 [Brassica napus]|uniref:C2 PI3K-type domain-containing protein n=1 Tax=Brassica napus TaxID=3708 RepID=A0ABQ8CVK1_BRANA|nr:hypothetical protein HID58_021122 [Brassica napus]KAH0921895.1 hypothetical protein HID58_021913 [Brassica napus]